MLGDVIAVEPQPVVGFRQPQPGLEMLGQRQPAVVHMVEHAELHRPASPVPFSASLARRAFHTSRNSAEARMDSPPSSSGQTSNSPTEARRISIPRPTAPYTKR